MEQMMVPIDATHYATFYESTEYFRKRVGIHVNSVIDHPTECFQEVVMWDWWNKDAWVHQGPGSGFSPRLVKPIAEYQK